MAKKSNVEKNYDNGSWTATEPGFFESQIERPFDPEEPDRDYSDELPDLPSPNRLKELAGLRGAPQYTGHLSVDEFLHDTLEIMRKKGHDYRQGNDEDLLHNFRKVAEAVDEPMMKVWFTYFYKHYAALTTFIKNDGQSESEPIEGRISDMIVYLILFREMVKQKQQAEHGVIV